MVQQYVLSTADGDRWRQTLPADFCVLGSVEYARICEQLNGGTARLFVVETKGALVVYPFLVRGTDSLPFATSDASGLDTYTPEYTGPLCVRSGCSQELAQIGFADRFAGYCREQGIVAEFAHLSPWHDARPLLDGGCVLDNREVVPVDLTLGEERLWTESLNSDTRRHIRRAQKKGVKVRWASSAADVRQFDRLYEGTMQRHQAKERYRLPVDYLLAVFDTMADHAFIALAEYEGQLVAGGLFFHGGSDIYWHLSAADREFSRVRPVNQYLWQTMRWAVAAGKRRMLLGGGYKPGDGVFHFKTGFSPLRAAFCTYRRIHDDRAYRNLTSAWAEHYRLASSRSDFFPVYRSVPTPEGR